MAVYGQNIQTQPFLNYKLHLNFKQVSVSDSLLVWNSFLIF